MADDSAYDEWRAQFDAQALRDTPFTTMSGIPLEPVYGPRDGEFPGVYPYTRGVHASMYRSKLWTMRMFAGFGTAHRHQRSASRTSSPPADTGLSTAFDMPTLLGLDSDDPMALGEVGRCGVAIDSLSDMRDLFADIDLASITTLDDHQLARRGDARALRRRRPRSPASSASTSAARSRTTS